MKNHCLFNHLSKRFCYYMAFLFCFALSSASWAKNSPIMELEWLDLVPEEERQLSDQLANDFEYGDTQMQSQLGAIRPELHGKQVRIPGFVIPLEGDAEEVTEFLLVPYYGSCIHTPPPPPNQIIHVSFPKAAAGLALWDVIYLEGKLLTEQNIVGMIETGYHIVGHKITPYE